MKDWTDLRGKPVCAKQGVSTASVSSRTSAAQTVFTGNTEALQALRSEKCVAYLTDDSNISPLLTSGEWPGYEMLLPSKYVNVWAIGVPRDELDGLWGRFISGMVYKWHASGRAFSSSARSGGSSRSNGSRICTTNLKTMLRNRGVVKAVSAF